MNEARISIYHDSDKGIDYITSWEGNDIAVWDFYMLNYLIHEPVRIGSIHESGGFKFEVLSIDAWNMEVSILYHRKGFIITWLRAKQFHFIMWCEMINHRLLMTAKIWNLLDFFPGEVLQWRKLKILRKFNK